MASKEKSFFGLTKRVALIVSLLALAVLMLGATTVFASDADENTGGNLVQIESGNAQYSTDGGTTWNEGLPSGTTRYSLDEGETWIEGTPPADAEKSLVAHGEGTPPAPGEEQDGSMMVQNDNGTLKYSTDGGQTWSEDMPDGASIASDGSFLYQNPNQ